MLAYGFAQARTQTKLKHSHNNPPALKAPQLNAINLDIFFSRYVLHNLAAAVPIDIPVEFDVGAGPVGAVDGASGESETLPLDGDVSMSPSFSGAIFVLARFVILLEK